MQELSLSSPYKSNFYKKFAFFIFLFSILTSFSCRYERIYTKLTSEEENFELLGIDEGEEIEVKLSFCYASDDFSPDDLVFYTKISDSKIKVNSVRVASDRKSFFFTLRSEDGSEESKSTFNLEIIPNHLFTDSTLKKRVNQKTNVVVDTLNKTVRVNNTGRVTILLATTEEDTTKTTVQNGTELDNDITMTISSGVDAILKEKEWKEGDDLSDLFTVTLPNSATMTAKVLTFYDTKLTIRLSSNNELRTAGTYKVSVNKEKLKEFFIRGMNISIEPESIDIVVEEPIEFKPLAFIPVNKSSDMTVTLKVTDGYYSPSHKIYYIISDTAPTELKDEGWTLWTTPTSTTGTIVTIPAGKNMYIKGDSGTAKSSGYMCFDFSANASVEGKISALLADAEKKFETPPGYSFYGLFHNNTHLTDASNLELDDYKELSVYCYSGMFYGCTSLTKSPKLPATTLADGCYSEMFYNCSALTEAPELKATQMMPKCYRSMFYNTAITSCPELNSTQLAESCYAHMFEGCTKLTKAVPSVPATTVYDYCYAYMFSGCKSLETIGFTLPAETLAQYCYRDMFYGCSKLMTQINLPATTLAKGCYREMFAYCISLTEITTFIPATEIPDEACYYMYSSCSKITTAPSMEKATKFGVESCERMFEYCKSLTTPVIFNYNITELKSRCFDHMFGMCENLKLQNKDTITQEKDFCVYKENGELDRDSSGKIKYETKTRAVHGTEFFLVPCELDFVKETRVGNVSSNGYPFYSMFVGTLGMKFDLYYDRDPVDTGLLTEHYNDDEGNHHPHTYYFFNEDIRDVEYK